MAAPLLVVQLCNSCYVPHRSLVAAGAPDVQAQDRKALGQLRSLSLGRRLLLLPLLLRLLSLLWGLLGTATHT